MARISLRELVLLDVEYFVDNVDPPFQCVVFIVILAVARMVMWQTRNKGIVRGCKLFLS